MGTKKFKKWFSLGVVVLMGMLVKTTQIQADKTTTSVQPVASVETKSIIQSDNSNVQPVSITHEDTQDETIIVVDSMTKANNLDAPVANDILISSHSETPAEVTDTTAHETNAVTRLETQSSASVQVVAPKVQPLKITKVKPEAIAQAATVQTAKSQASQSQEHQQSRFEFIITIIGWILIVAAGLIGIVVLCRYFFKPAVVTVKTDDRKRPR